MKHKNSQTPQVMIPLWIGRMMYIFLAIVLPTFFYLGLGPEQKLLTLKNLGLNPIQNKTGEFVLFPVSKLPAGDSGLQPGDVLLAVNNMAISPKMSTAEILRNFAFPLDRTLELDVRSLDENIHQVRIPLDHPIPALFGLSAISLAHWQSLLDLLLALGFLIPSLIIFWRKFNDPFGMFVSVTLLLTGLRSASTILFVPNKNAVLLAFFLFALSRICLLVFLFIFPDGRFVPSWTRRFVTVGGVWAVLSIFFTVFYGLAGQIMDLVIFAVGIGSQIHRYRHVASSQEQQQTKWIAAGMVVAFVTGYFFTLIGFLPAIQNSTLAALRLQVISQMLSSLALLAVPLTITISIFRYRLYEIDILINRALVYGTLTAILSGLYIALIGFFSRLFIAFTGQKTEFVTVLTTLIVVAAMTPLKNWLQGSVDKRFKETPDAGKRLRNFTGQVRSRLFAIDADQTTRRLLEEAVLAFNAASGAIFLGGPEPIHATRNWDGREKIGIRICGINTDYGRLALGEKRSGMEYSKQDRQLLHEVVKEIAMALEQDRLESHPAVNQMELV